MNERREEEKYKAIRNKSVQWKCIRSASAVQKLKKKTRNKYGVYV